MLNSLIRWSLERRFVVIFLAFALLAGGLYSAASFPLDVLPDFTAPTVTVLVEAGGMAPSEMESLVTFPIEAALNGAAGIRRVRSATAVGVAVIFAEFEWGQDIMRARQVVNEKLALVTASLPPQVNPPFLAPVSSIMGEILFLTLESDRHSELELRTLADTNIRRRLLAVPGVSQVIPAGGAMKQYQVLVSPSLLEARGVTLTAVEDALREGSANSSAGFRVSGGQEYLIQGIGRAATMGDLGSIPVAAPGGRPIYVRDVAEVRVGGALKRGDGSHNGRPAVVLGIHKQPGANTLELTRRLDLALDDIEAGLPKGMKINRNVFRQANFIERALANLTLALRDGALLVVIVVTLFLMNFRAAVITLLAIPLSMVAAALTMNWFGYTINSMSLGGLAIAIGELVDDAIIDVENVLRRLRENAALPAGERLDAIETVYRASSEIRGSVVFATLIVVLVFLPLFALTGVEGRLLAPLGFAYVTSLLASLAVALTVTPALCAVLLPNARGVLSAREPWLVHLLKRAYAPLLERAIAWPWMVAVPSLAALAVSAYSLTQMGRTFLPDFNEGTLTVSSVTVPGTSLQDSSQIGSALERVMLSVPEVVSTARRTGRAELDEHVQGVESSEIDVVLEMKDRGKEEVLADLRRRFQLLPGMNVTVGQPISHRIDHMLSGTRANIAVKFFGDDLTVLRTIARQAEAVMRGVPGAVDVAMEPQTDIPTIRVKVRATEAARYGLSPGQVSRGVQTAFTGVEVGRLYEGPISFPVVLRYPPTQMNDLDVIARTRLSSPAGAQVPIAAVADVREDRGPNFISREGVQRKIVVQANVAGRDLRGVVEEMRRGIAKAVPLPPGYRVEYGGQFESEESASRLLLILGIAVIAGILLILALVFRSLRDALIIMLNLPLALVGGVWGVHAGGGVLSVASIIGFITLFGIATRNGIMLVSHIRHLREAEGVTDPREAVLRGASERLSPILMTALAAGLALIPIANGMGKPGSELQAPIALVILYGLLSSTVLNMFVVPAIYWSAICDRRAA